MIGPLIQIYYLSNFKVKFKLSHLNDRSSGFVSLRVVQSRSNHDIRGWLEVARDERPEKINTVTIQNLNTSEPNSYENLTSQGSDFKCLEFRASVLGGFSI